MERYYYNPPIKSTKLLKNQNKNKYNITIFEIKLFDSYTKIETSNKDEFHGSI